MASIPLPALDIKTPQPAQQDDYSGNLQNLLQLQNSLKAGQLRQQAAQQQVQSGQLDIQQKQQQLNDQKAMTTAMQQWDGKDYNDILPLVLKNGGSATAVMGLKQKILEQQQTISTTLKNQGQGAEAQANAQKTKGDLLDGALSPLIDPKQTPDDQLPQALMQTAQGLVQSGVLDPQHAQQAAQLAQSGNPPQIRQQLDLMRKTNMAQSQIMDEALKTAQTGEAQANTQKIQQETQFGPTGSAAEAKYRFILQKAASGQQLSPDETSFARGFEASQAKTSTQADTLGVTSTSTSRPSGLASVSRLPRAGSPAPSNGTAAQSGALTPGQTKADLVDMVGQYQADPRELSRISYRHPDVLALVHAKYPDWDQTNYEAKNKVAQYFTSGKGAQQLTAFNTAMGHLDTFQKLAGDLDNSDIQIVNRAKQAWSEQTGNPAPANFAAAKNAMSGEVAAALKTSGATDQEIAKVGDTFNRAQSPAQLGGAIGTYRSLLQTKANILKQQYQQGIHGQPNFSGGAPAAAPAGATMKVPGSDGKLHWSDGKQDLGVAE